MVAGTSRLVPPLVLCAALAFLSGCSTLSWATTQPGTTATVATPTTAPAADAPAGGLRQLHSPGTVADDLQLQPGQCHVRVIDGKAGLVLPDPLCTPGAIDPAVTQENLDSTICRHGYTATVRPPASNTGRFKHESLLEYGQTYNRTTEYDHLVSLELGGTNSVSNLFPEPNRTDAKGTTNPKDPVENALNQAVCSHKVTLAAAQQAIATDWTTAERVLGLPSSTGR